MIAKAELTKQEYQVLSEAIIVVAYLHDINDAKYDKDGLLDAKLREFLRYIYAHHGVSAFNPDDTPTTTSDEYTDIILAIIHAISYSRENRAIEAGFPINFEKRLGKIAALIRNIVSDADKLCAIGIIGLNRCEEYTIAYNPDISRKKLIYEVVKHYDEKLSRLSSEFIRTKTGKEMAAPLDEAMLRKITIYRNLLA
jgi:HD superfamily phosphodiesterase